MTLNQPIVSDRDALERLREKFPELRSHLRILQIPEAEFIATYGPQLPGGERQACRVYRLVQTIQDRVALIWANLKDAAAINPSRFTTIPTEFLNQQGQIPSYQQLFGTLDAIDCDDCHSVLSPAAYFVDLMRFIQVYITDAHTLLADLTLEGRRADLFQLPLDCDSTYELLPAIDLVIEALEGMVTSITQPDADAVLAEAVFPWGLPFNRPLTELQLYLEQQRLTLSQVYRLLAAAEPEANTAIARAELNLSPEDYALLSQGTVTDLAPRYGFTAAADLDSLSQVPVFLERTGLSRDELNQLLGGHLSTAEANAGLAQLLFINRVDDGLGALAIASTPAPAEDPRRLPVETLQNLSPAKLDRIRRFVTLAQRLDWSFADLDWALRSLGGPSLLPSLLYFDGINDYVAMETTLPLTRFTAEVWANPRQHRFNPLLSKGSADGEPLQFAFWIDPEGYLAFSGARPQEGSIYLRSLEALPAGEFSHLAVSVSGTQVRFYINGVETETVAYDSAAGTPTVTDQLPEALSQQGSWLNLGRDLNACTFAGVLAELRIWDGVRQAPQLAETRYRRLTGREPGLLGYWPLLPHGSGQLPDLAGESTGIPGGPEFVTQPTWVRRALILSAPPQAIGSGFYEFNGADEFFGRRGEALPPLTQLTLEAWVGSGSEGPVFTLGDGTLALQVEIDERPTVTFGGTTVTAAALPADRFGHLAVTVSGSQVGFWIDGVAAGGGNLLTPLDLRPDRLELGRDLERRYFRGQLQEVRLWDHRRTHEQLSQFLHRRLPAQAPGLLGYWPLQEAPDGTAVVADLSPVGLDLYRGGVPADFRPATAADSPQLPDGPVAAAGTVLGFDGDNDVVRVVNPENRGLGSYAHFTLEFWFRPQDLEHRRDRNQLLFSQGDGEAGLSVVLSGGQLSVLSWCANYELTDVQETAWGSGVLTSGRWYHLAITQNACDDAIEFRAYLDAEPLTLERSSHPQPDLPPERKGYGLSPVGAASVGGLALGLTSRVLGAYLDSAQHYRYPFAGEITEVRLWNRVRSQADIAASRRVASSRADDFIAYLPLIEGTGITVADALTDSGYEGTLQQRNITYRRAATPPTYELENAYAHYQPDASVLDWRSYDYRGRLYVETDESAIGVTFYSRYPDEQARFYRLRRHPLRPAFYLDAYPFGAIDLKGQLESEVVPDAQRWYRFHVRVDTNGDSTRIAASVWPDGEPQPDAPQMQATDTSEGRIDSGTVGIWAFGSGRQHFDDLTVTGDDGTRLLAENFEPYGEGDTPPGWVETSVRPVFGAEANLFEVVEVRHNLALGTESERDHLHTHYLPEGIDVSQWDSYEVSGRLRFSDEASGVGITVFSQFRDRNQYYRLDRPRGGGEFRLIPQGDNISFTPNVGTVRPVDGTQMAFSGVISEPNRWYRFRLQVWHEAPRTHLRAKVWPAEAPEPTEFAMVARDSGGALSGGAVGIWSAGAGTKVVDDLAIVAARFDGSSNQRQDLYREDFESFEPGQVPPGWSTTRDNFSLAAASEPFFTTLLTGTRALGSTDPQPQQHVHYQPDESVLRWRDYAVTGQLFVDSPDSGIGVTVYSRYPAQLDRYYRLSRDAHRPGFHLTAHPEGIQLLEASEQVSVQPETWYRFRLEVRTDVAGTRLQGRVWPASAPEPTDFPLAAYDDSPLRLTAGTVGIWASGEGRKYADDLQVLPLAGGPPLLLEDFEAYAVGDRPPHWVSVAARSAFEADDDLFETGDIGVNLPRWRQIADYPLLRRPLQGSGLSFDGEDDYLAGDDLDVDAERFTLAAWVRPTRPQVNPVLLWREANGAIAWFGIGRDNTLVLRTASGILSGTATVPLNEYAYIAVAVEPEGITFYLNGEGERVADTGIRLNAPQIEVGRDFENSYFAGEIYDLRLWQRALSAAEFAAASRFQQPDLADPSLLLYWNLADDTLVSRAAPTSSGAAPVLHAGGLPGARQPRFQPGEGEDLDFWRPNRHALTLTPADRGLRVAATTEAEILPRRTVELWFQAVAPERSEPQVIYHQGDAKRGLVIYLAADRLYVGGYNLPQGESGWGGTWLSSDRIRPGQWHHLALVLDGRREVRPQSLRAYLDGKVMDVGPGSQLWDATDGFSLGAAGPWRSHRGAEEAGVGFQGQILELRLWNTARSRENIAEHRFQLPQERPQLILAWAFDAAEADGTVPDGAENRSVVIPSAQLQRWVQPQLATLPALDLTPQTLETLALLPPLLTRHRLDVEPLVALWSEPRPTGSASGPPLFDQIFNPPELGTPWTYADGPVCEPEESEANCLRSRRSRLQGSLQLSPEDLDRLLVALGITPLQLTTDHLVRLYRLARLARVLRYSVADLLRLLELLELSAFTSLDAQPTPAQLAFLSERAEQLRQQGLRIDEIDYFTQDIASRRIPRPFGDTALRDLADTLGRQSADFLVRRTTFISDTVSEGVAAQILQRLVDAKLVHPSGAILQPITEAALTAQLQDLAVDVPLTELISLQDQQRSALLAGLADLLEVEVEVLQLAMDYLGDAEPDLLTPTTLLVELLGLFEAMVAVAAQPRSAGAAPPEPPLPAGVVPYLERLYKLLYLTLEFELTAAETRALLQSPALFGVEDPLAPTLAALESLARFRALKQAFEDTSGLLLAVLREEDGQPLRTAIASLTGWAEANIQALIAHFGPEAGPFNRVEGIDRLRRAFELMATLGGDVAALLQLSRLDDLSIEFYRQRAAEVLGELRSQSSPEQFPQIFRPLRDRLALARRDALLQLAMTAIPRRFEGRRSPDVISEYLLLDVQVGSEVETSRLVQGLASLQLYVQRSLMSLERDITLSATAAQDWEWMKNYRVWEANRKVFLYPENYIEPELRDDKTPEFESLEQELMQTDISQESVERAYTHYLNRFAEVSGLKIVGTYLHRPLPGEQDTVQDDVLYVVGRTSNQPRVYYYRTLTSGRWQPWQKIDLTINADIVTPVFAFNRLFLFWVEATAVAKSVDRPPVTVVPLYRDIGFARVFIGETLRGEGVTQQDIDDFRAGRKSVSPRPRGYLVNERTGERVQTNIDVYNPTVKYSQQSFSRDWSAPQTYLDLQNELIEAEFARPEWQRVYAQRSLQLFDEPPQPLPDRLFENTSVLQVSRNTVLERLLPLFDMGALTYSFWLRLEDTTPPSSLSGRAAETEADLPRRTLPLVTYQESDAENPEQLNTLLSIAARNRFQRHPQAPNIPAARAAVEAAAASVEVAEATAATAATAVETAQTSLTNAQANLTAAQASLTSARAALGADSGNAALAAAVASAEAAVRTAAGQVDTLTQELARAEAAAATAAAALTTARSELAQAEARLEQALDAPQWQVIDPVVRLQFSGAGALDLPLSYDSWQHLAFVLDYDGSGYQVSAYRHGVGGSANSPITATLTASLLPVERQLAIGAANAEDLDDQGNPGANNIEASAFRAAMVELQLWSQLRSGVTIFQERNRRQDVTQQPGLFHLALDSRLPGADMVITSSDLDLRQVLPPIREVSERERILVFYGDSVRSIRSNLEEQGFTLDFRPVTFSRPNFDVNLALSRLYLGTTRQLSLNDYATGTTAATPLINGTSRVSAGSLLLFNRLTSHLPSHPLTRYLQTVLVLEQLQTNTLLDAVPTHESVLLDVGNQPGWYVLNTGDEQFLLRPAAELPLQTTAERLRVSYEPNQQSIQPQAVALSYVGDPTLESPPARFAFERLNTFAAEGLSLRLFKQGIDGLLSLTSQRLQELDFNGYDPNLNLVQPPNTRNGSPDRRLDFNGAYGRYYWEIFFHIPFLIANRLNDNQNFAESQRWYHYIFDPTRQEPLIAGESGTDGFSYWQFRPFRELGTLESFREMITDDGALAAYRQDPFNPHAIARLRLSAYQKTVVMKYIDNLLDWGDALFRQDSRESINEAAQLYILAFNLLGPRPLQQPAAPEPVGSYEGIQTAFAGTAPPTPIPDFLYELEAEVAATLFGSGAIPLTRNGNIVTTFCVPENTEFLAYWDRVEDRLFKIRHSLNIEGVFRQLALFQPPLDVRALVQAAAAGGRDIGSLLSDLGTPVPHYRYSFMLDRAKEVIETAQGFGSALLNALESRDGERLAALENTHARTLLEAMTRIKELARDEADMTIRQLEISRSSALNRVDHYQGLISAGLSPEEIAELVIKGVAQLTKAIAGTIKAVKGATSTLPQVIAGAAGAGGSPYAVVEFGGTQAASPLETGAEIAILLADLAEAAGDITAKVGEYKRREQDWQLELATSEFSVEEINAQIDLAQLQRQVADLELAAHQREIEQTREIGDFYRSKFTNQELYGWMISRLSGLYFQAYNLAYDFAKSAERAMQYELPSNDRFISFGHWDSLRRGLLAGEALQMELHQLERYQLDNDSRFLEIEKTISLAEIDPAALLALVSSGRCSFELGELLFDRDYPGHYFRVIKTLAVSVVLARGFEPPRHKAVNATLIQLGSRALLDPDLSAVEYLVGRNSTQPEGSVLRVNWRANQQIAISQLQEDDGMFVLNFFLDDRYFPFEGTGAVSTWQLEVPHFSNGHLLDGDGNLLQIDDILIHLRYTAKTERGSFQQDVQSLVQEIDQG